MEFNVVNGKKAFVLFDNRIARNSKNVYQIFKIQALCSDDNRKATHEFRNHSKIYQILGDHIIKTSTLDFGIFNLFLHFCTESNRGRVCSMVDYPFQACKRSATDKENISRVDLQKVATRVFAARFLWYVNDVAFDDLQKRMLDPFSRHIATNANVTSRLSNLVCLVNVNDAFLATLDILPTFQVQFEKNTLDIFSHVSCLGEAGSIGNHQGDINHTSQCFNQMSLSTSSWSKKHDIALVNFTFFHVGSKIIIRNTVNIRSLAKGRGGCPLLGVTICGSTCGGGTTILS
mmetsp:Transcript_23128/g.37587  ORF Transcript_23128/g.37587 Transcript_23128/m.37587 type:complete len:289 (-) Transcript_23128:385-1251(-)